MRKFLLALIVVLPQHLFLTASQAVHGECLPTDSNQSQFQCFAKQNKEEDCVDRHSNCEEWAVRGECEVNPDYMLWQCRSSCRSCHGHVGTTQRIHDMEPALVAEHFFATAYYVDTSSFHAEGCRNRDEMCTVWAVQGKCESDRDRMKELCAPACRMCVA